MPKVHSKALDQSIEVDRCIGIYGGEQPGPSLVFTAGIHGNEPAGVFALHRVLQFLDKEQIPIKGKMYAISGNLSALMKEERFHQHDLNRLWSSDRMEMLKSGELKIDNADVAEQVALYKCISEILDDDPGPFYFMDLHTTSSETIPFAVVNDMMLNRKFTDQYPVPIILGIEEYLEGPLLSYINEQGYVAFGFEGGQHDDLASIENHMAFIFLSLVFAGCLEKDKIDFNHHYTILARSSVGLAHFYEIFYRYQIRQDDQFEMAPGYVNFQDVKKGELLATAKGKPIHANRNAKVFMPLYQSQGSEGFFAIREIPRRFLRWSAYLRKMKLDHLLVMLPGVSWTGDNHEVLMINRKVARYFTKAFFHLLGYRSKSPDRNHYLMKNREANSRDDDYREAPWS